MCPHFFLFFFSSCAVPPPHYTTQGMGWPRSIALLLQLLDPWRLFFVALSLTIFSASCTANTGKGSCSTLFGQKPDGAVWYDDAQCIKITCKQGLPVTSSCVTPQLRGPNCKLVEVTGRFPACCPKLVCTSGIWPRQGDGSDQGFGEKRFVRDISARQGDGNDKGFAEKRFVE